MPPWEWATPPSEQVQAFEKHNQANNGAGGLFIWAAQCVESLHYLADLDQELSDEMSFAGYSLVVADVAHARWATSTCITAIDLCAAGLGRAFCGHVGQKEFDLTYFDPNGQKGKRLQDVNERRSRLSQAGRVWIDGVLADPQYKEIKAARNPLTHSLVARHHTLGIGSPTRIRLRLTVDNNKIGVRELIEDARDLATEQISDFLELLPQL